MDYRARAEGYAPRSDDGVRAGLARHGAAPGGATLMEQERLAAVAAIQTGVYCVWRCDDPRAKDFCTRIGRDHRCFCGHRMRAHDLAFLADQAQPPPCLVAGCKCESFDFIPSRPEEVGDWHLVRRRGFDVQQWSVKCRCTHSHMAHACRIGRPRRCTVRGCKCSFFEATSQCVVCERPLADHRTVVETERERQGRGLPVRDAYLPLCGESEATRAAVFGSSGAIGGPSVGRSRAPGTFSVERSLRPAFGGGGGGGFGRRGPRVDVLGDSGVRAADEGDDGVLAAARCDGFAFADDEPIDQVALDEFQRRLTRFYEAAAPAKLHRVPAMALKFYCDPTALWLRLRRKYPSYFCGERAADYL